VSSLGKPLTSLWAGRRARVLFVDDQADVARTLAGLLSGRNIACSFASDGEDALRRVRLENYDLLAIDLRMPPGEWGGLWLLRALAQQRIDVATVVLSGEAGQQETIDALRLGARDFVVKDAAGAELADRIQTALDDGARDRLGYAVDHLPAPMAIRVSDMLAKTGVADVLRAALAVGEVALQLVGLLSLSGWRADLDTASRELEALARPSMGTWNRVCQDAAKRGANAWVQQWARAITGPGADSAVLVRNDVAHGGNLTMSWAEERLPATLDWLDEFVLGARMGVPLELLLPREMEFDGTSFIAEVASLSGSKQTGPWRRELFSKPLTTGHVHLAAEGAATDLWPLVLASGVGAARRLLLWDGIKQSRRGAISPDDRLRYIDIVGVERFIHPDLSVADLVGIRPPTG
jgi:DNA-binding response OmpR family regulator